MFYLNSHSDGTHSIPLNEMQWLMNVNLMIGMNNTYTGWANGEAMATAKIWSAFSVPCYGKLFVMDTKPHA